MAVIENRFVCDLAKPVQAQALKGNVFSLDNLGSRISVLIFSDGSPSSVTGSVTANCILPDGSTVNINGSLEENGSKAYVDIPQSCLLIPGVLKIAIKVTNSGTITTLAAIVANVYMTKTDNVITPSQQIIDDWNAEISSAIAGQDADIAKLKETQEDICQTYPVVDQDYGSGGIMSNGATQSNSARIRSASNSSKAVQIMVGDFYYVDPAYSAVLHVYSSKIFNMTNHVARVSEGNGILAIPSEYVGKYAAVSIKKIGHESDDISGEVSTINTKVVYYRSALGNRKTDKTLSLADYPADAEATGKNFLTLKNDYATSIPDNTDFDTLTTPGNYKVTSTSSAESMTNIPYTAAGGRLAVLHVINSERFCQLYITSQTAIKAYIRFKGTSWGSWQQIAYKSEMDDADNYIRSIIEKGSNQINLKYGSGNINNGGGTSSDNLTRIRTASNNILTPAVAHGDYVYADPAYKVKIALYNSRKYTTGNFVGFVSSSFQNGWIAIPDTFIGKYVGIVVQKVGYEESDISADIPTIQQYVRYIRPQNGRGYTDGERPVYAAFGASTTAGAVHHYTGEGITYTNNNFPDYLSSVLGLETFNLAVGSTGFLERANGDDNIMDQIYNNSSILSRAKLVTIMFGYGNDNWVGSPSKYFSIGHYTDYYPYDEEGYHPSGQAGLNTMISKGATLMGCLNWCIKWISEKYPLAQLILIFGSPSANDERSITMTAQTEGKGVAPYTLTFEEDPFKDNDDHYSAEYGIYLINEEIKKLKKAMDIPIVNLFYEGNAFNWYSTYAKNPNDASKYALFSTTADATSDTSSHEHWNSHPNEVGYLYYARYVAGKVISLFKH